VTFPISSFGTAPMTPAEFVEAPLGKIENYALMLTCYEGCERLGSCSLQLMAAKLGRRAQLRAVLRRLRCSGCKRPPATVAITDGGLNDKLPTWRVVLTR
jgi:hypothetical protein